MFPRALLFCVLSLLGGIPAGAVPLAKRPGQVVLAEKPGIMTEFQAPVEESRALFRQGLLKWTGAPDPKAAWIALGVQADDVVGIKITTSGGPIMATRRPLVEEIIEGLQAVGVRRIVVWDKLSDEMARAGYVNKEGAAVQFKGVIPNSGFDGNLFYLNEVLGRLIWGDFEFRKKISKESLLEAAAVDKKKKSEEVLSIEEQTSNKSYFCKILTQECTKIINLPTLTDHETLGIYGCLSSLALGSVDNSRRFLMGDQQGDPAIGEILDRDLFKKKVVLHVLDALLGQFAGGPTFAPQYTRNWGALYFGNDPVAIDALAVQRIQSARKDTKVVLFEKTPKHVTGATELGLGESDLKRIQIIRP